jgi:hypothetical protein
MSEEKNKIDVESPRGGAAGGDAGGTLAESPLLPDRDIWLDAMADMESRADRRYESLSRRVGRLESRKGLLGAMDEETKTIVLLVGAYLCVSVLLPAVLDQVQKWRSRS